jgi:hypothetical protein
MANNLKAAVRRIALEDALNIINQYSLSTALGAWHYSWNLAQFYDDTPIHEWAPAPLFSNDASLKTLIGQKGKGCPYWFLRLTGFEPFLRRRSAISRQPEKHFPSEQTYPRFKRKLKCRTQRYSLVDHEERFTTWYSALKDPRYHHSGADCVRETIENNRHAPQHWFVFYALVEEGSEACKSVALMIDDSRSCSMINTASERRAGFSYGTYLLVEVIKDLCGRGYFSFDCGVSATYGQYKNKIFLDTLPVDSSGNMPWVVA